VRAHAALQDRGTSPAVEVVEASIPELARALEEGRSTSVQLVDAYLARIAAYDRRGPALNSIVRLNPNARARARALDAERANGSTRGPLHGIPILLKDNYDTADLPTTGGSIALATHVPPDDGFLVRRLREAGAIVLAKTTLHELAMGIETVASIHGRTRNPYDPRRNPGGSSGGTGAGVAASFAAVGMGSDTCGSIRIPSSHNNLVGLRGTAGIASRDGIIPLSHTQDIGGPLARTVRDLATVLDVIVGPDPADPVTEGGASRLSGSFVAGLDGATLRGARIGLVLDLFGDAPEDGEVADVVHAALGRMNELGAEVEEVALADLDALLEDSSVIAHEFKFDLIDYLAAEPDPPVRSMDDILARGLFHAELEQRFRLRNQVESRDTPAYRAALAKQTAIREAVEALLAERDLVALAYPTIRRIPARLGDPQSGSNCALSAHSGLPAISMPAGFTEEQSPVGVELIGRAHSDVELVGLAYAWEQATGLRRAPATTPPLVDGLAPAPVSWTARAESADGSAVLTARFTHDATTSQLAYDMRVTGVESRDLLGAYLHQGPEGAEGAAGPVVSGLLPQGEPHATGVIELSPRDAAALAAGRLYLQLDGSPEATARARLTRPARTR
jgi:Asp-tRNA(Asn)/Glu-tRNA(Gln) amidotransferase A subunit family amidase